MWVLPAENAALTPVTKRWRHALHAVMPVKSGRTKKKHHFSHVLLDFDKHVFWTGLEHKLTLIGFIDIWYYHFM
jgi:hypothetical protein